MELFWANQWPDMEERYNIAPTQSVLAVTSRDGDWRADYFRWGLVPSFVKEPGTGPIMINARCETLRERSSFRHLVDKKRCLIPADGYYEWNEREKQKVPFLFELTSGEVFAFAGLYDVWKGPDGQIIQSCTLITKEPNGFAAQYHDRMPAILLQHEFRDYLDLSNPIEAFCSPTVEGILTAREVNQRLGNSRNEGPDLLLTQDTLF